MLEISVVRCLAIVACGGQPTLAQSTVSRADRYAYSANLGWISLDSSPSRLYRIERDTDLTGVWADSEHGTFAPDAGGTTNRTLYFSAGRSRFFRAVALRPLR